jgi:membrane-associated phospholipid phosphatase
LGLALFVPTLLLTAGVVYCQMHYGVDALAGLMIGALVALALGVNRERATETRGAERATERQREPRTA